MTNSEALTVLRLAAKAWELQRGGARGRREANELRALAMVLEDDGRLEALRAARRLPEELRGAIPRRVWDLLVGHRILVALDRDGAGGFLCSCGEVLADAEGGVHHLFEMEAR